MHFPVQLPREVIDEVVGEKANVVAPFPQRGRADLQHRESVEEVLSEGAVLDHLLEVPMGRRDDAHVGSNLGGAAHPAEGLVFHEAEQFRLQRRGHLADLVQEDGAAPGRFEQALLLGARVGERAALVAEELRLQERLGERRAGDVHEGAIAPWAGSVDRSSGEVLSGSALADHQHRRGRALRELVQHPSQLTDRFGASDDSVVRLPAAQPAHLAAQAGGLQGALGDHGDLVDVEGLGEEVEGADLHRVDRPTDGRERRQQNDRDVGVVVLEPLQHLQPVDVRQAVVEEDQVEGVSGEGLDRFLTGGHADRPMALGLHPLGEGPTDQLLIVDDEDRDRARGRAGFFGDLRLHRFSRAVHVFERPPHNKLTVTRNP